MLLKLIPAHPDPTIHFSFAFSDLPQNVNTPLSWSSQLSHLIVEELEVPNTVHSFDKAAGLTGLLEEVAFDIERGEVRCRFVDGGVEEWGFFRFGGNEIDVGAENGFEAGQKEGRKLLVALENIIRDVKASTQEDERLFVESEKEIQRLAGLERSKSRTLKHGHGRMHKHKKQRSMFMQFVSSIGSTIANLTSPSSTPSLPSHQFSASLALPLLYQSPESPSQIPPHLPGSSPRARALRRAARSALVDTYRRFVLSELTRRMPAFSYRDDDGKFTGVHGGGFCVWILYSMRRRAQERIDQLLEEAEMVMSERAKDTAVSLSPSAVGPDNQQLEWIPEKQPQLILEKQEGEGLEPTTTMVPLIFDDEDETETETDDSSLHTPSTSSHLACYPVRPPTSASFQSQVSSGSQNVMECQQQSPIPSKDSESIASLSPSSSPTLPPSPTPSSSPTSPTPPNSPTPSSSQPASPSSESLTGQISTRPTSSMLSQNLTDTALVEYNHLTDLRERLWHLAMFAESQTRIAAEEVRNRLEVLAVRSRRRAWSVGEFKAGRYWPGLGAQGPYGFAMPFRSSPLSRFSWTAEDLKKEQEKELQAAFSSSCVSVAGFPSYLGADDSVGEEDVLDLRPLVEREFDLYEEFPGPSPLDLRGGVRRRRNHRRRKDALEFGLSGGVGRLFPVSEELEGEGEEAVDLEFRVALGGASAPSYALLRGRRKERKIRTFMGCDEVHVEGDDEEEEKNSHSQETLVDDEIVDPRELDIELGFGFDFHQKGDGSGFLGHSDDYNLFGHDEDDEDDEDEFKFDLSAQLERPKIRPRVRTSSIFAPRDIGQASKVRTTAVSATTGSSSSILCQPVNFAAAPTSSHNLPLYPSLSKSAPSSVPPRPSRTPAQHSSHPVLDISRTPSPSPAIYYEPDVVDVDIRLGGEYDVSSYPHHTPISSYHQKLHHSTSEVDLRKRVQAAGVLSKPLLVSPIPMPFEVGSVWCGDEQEEFTLAMDLPRAVAGGVGSSGSTGKRWSRYAGGGGGVVTAGHGRSIRLFGDGHGPSC